MEKPKARTVRMVLVRLWEFSLCSGDFAGGLCSVFQGSVVGGAEGTRWWGVSMDIAMLVVALVSPILGAITDYSVAI